MNTRFSLTLPSGTDYVVDIPTRYPFAQGEEQFQRQQGPTVWGTLLIEPLSGTRRLHRLRIVEADRVAQRLRTLWYLAHRYLRDVTYWPDYTNEPGESWVIELDLEQAVTTTEDSRLELIIPIVEQSPEAA